MRIATLHLSGNAHDRRVRLRQYKREFAVSHPAAVLKRRSVGQVEVTLPGVPKVSKKKRKH